ncbi:hypothetical protein QOZ80_7BG0584230 [Eleusine coracana subsp. coracana]|nr:hypothetical protein QOZ80_7BG0584230 [Eleusine coracana subsp. coracana]
MAGLVSGLITSAVVKTASDKLSSAITEPAGLLWNFSNDLVDMKDTIESMEAVLKDATKQSVKKKSVQLWLNRLEHSVLDISDMMDDYQDTEKMPGRCSCLTVAHKKMALANKMKNMRKKLRKINEERQNFDFTLSIGTSLEHQHYDHSETTTVRDEAKIVGRDKEKKEITDLLSASCSNDGTMILPIYGLGGIGKSTLAGLVYNDNQFKQYDYRVWVYVSQVFNLNKIGRSIISQLPAEADQQNTNELHMIYQCLDNLLPGKKILIVLDDIWEEDDYELEKLKSMLHVDKEGSMVDVIVTTRTECVANKICTNESYKLQPLKDDVCWDIIKRSSRFEDKSNKEKLEHIGLDIAKKCGGNDINEDDLIHQWVSLGFINKPLDGKEYIRQLLGMSFLQHSKLPLISGKHVVRYNMHDLVHDMATFVINDKLTVIDATKENNANEIAIEGCPRLRLKPCPPAFRKCTIERSDLVISSLEVVSKNGRITYSTPSTMLWIQISDSSSLQHAEPRVPSVVGEKLTNLQKLRVVGNQELKQWCESEENKRKLAHISHIEYEYCH